MVSDNKWDSLRKRVSEVPTVDILGFMGIECAQSSGEIKVKCFQPDNHTNGDANPSLAVNPRTGKWYCFVCKVGGPDILSLLVKKFPKRSPRFILEDTCHQFVHPVVPSDAVDECHKRLMNTTYGEDFRKALKARRGYPDEALITFKLGLDDSKRITIPVMGPYGLYQDMRRWDAFRFDPTEPKFLAWAKGFGKPSAGKWWPADPTGISPVIFEGEPDTILGRTLGLDGITVISGASQFDKLDSSRWRIFSGKSVTIVPDADKAGQSALGTILRELAKAGTTKVRVAIPPKPSKDFTEWVMAKSVASVLATIEQTPWQTPDSAASPLPPAALRDITRPEAVNVPISFNGQVSRVAMQPSLLPKRFKVTCNGDKESLCPSCPNMAQGCAGVYEVQLTDDTYIDTLDQPTTAVTKSLKHHAKIPSECKVSVEVLDHYGAIHAVLIPHTGKIDRSITDHVTRDVVYCGDFLMAGSASRFHGYTRPDPKTQKAITVITKAQDNARPWQNYKIPRCEADALAALFDRRDPYNMLKWMASKISKYYTKVVGRDLLHMVIDVALHSALEIPIAGQSEPGFMDVAIVGNSSTGKGKSAEGILRMLGAGEIVSGKRATVAGLIGGTVRHQQGYDVAIGVFSLRDGEAVVIDEGTKPDVFREMTRARREGLAEFTQAGISHTANARCRKIWLLNAPHPKHMGSYRFGIEVLRDLVAAEEDVARWDLAVGVLSDVDEKLIDAASLPLTDEAPISLATLRARLFWAWSRKVQDIHIEKSARDAISECLSDLVKRYETSAVGLVQKGNTHVKLRKGAVAVALATFSTKDGVNVLVSDKHVRAYAQIIRDALDAPALRLGEMVLANKGSGQIDDMPAVINIFKRLRTRSAARRFLQAKPGPVFSWEALVPEKENPRETIRSLIRHGALLDTKGEVQATKEFGDFLQKLVGTNGTPQV